MPARSKMREIEQREGKPIAVVLRETYAKCKSQKEVAAILGVSSSRITEWRQRLHLHVEIILVEEKCNA